MFSGWGIRTMSSRDAGYNPIEYHNGTVCRTTRRSSPRGSAVTGSATTRLVAWALFEAAEEFGYRLPEVFAATIAREYSSRSSTRLRLALRRGPPRPPLLEIRNILGLEADAGRRDIQPVAATTDHSPAARPADSPGTSG